MEIKKNYLIEKRNILNEIRGNPMTLQELRFFLIYLSKINARDTSTRLVRFSMQKFQKIMEMTSLNMTQLQQTADGLLGKVVGVTLENGSHARFQLFKKTVFLQDEIGNRYIEIDAHDDALPLMFEFKEKYFTYELWNALTLKSSNQLRMYELLKQYEKLGYRIFAVDDLKELLGMKKSDYPRYNSFKADVLDVCKEALETSTDIKFTYEPTGKLGRGAKVYHLKFNIYKNENYIIPPTLSDYIDAIDAETDKIDKEIEIDFKSERLEFLAGACNNEFSEAEIKILYNLIIQVLPRKVGEFPAEFNLRVYDHLSHRYDELNWRDGSGKIRNRFAYFKKRLEADVKEINEINEKKGF